MRSTSRSLAALSLVVALIPSIVSAYAPAALPSRTVSIYPTATQMMPYGGTWPFAIRSVPGARGYLWSFVQDDVIRWQNLAFEHRLSGRTYTIAQGSTAHRHLHPGMVFVWVQALLRNERWSGVTTLVVRLIAPPSPTAVPAPTDTPAPAPTNTAAPTCAAGQQLYEADANNGELNAMRGPASWKHLNGMLINDGSDSNPLKIPYIIQCSDYAVEADVQLLNASQNDFGIEGRLDSFGNGGYGSDITCCPTLELKVDGGATIGSAAYTPDTNWHTYRLEMRGNDIRVLVDGAPLIDAHDNKHLNGSGAAIWSKVQLSVRRITVTAL